MSQLQDYVCIRKYSGRMEAEMVTELLRYQGIAALISDYDSLDGHFGDDILLNFSVMVRIGDVERAEAILKISFTDL